MLANIVTVSKARLNGGCITELSNEINEMNEKILTSLGLFRELKDLREKVSKDKKFIKKIIDDNYKLKNSLKEVVKNDGSEEIKAILKKYDLDLEKL